MLKFKALFRRLLIPVAVLAVSVVLVSCAEACPGCKDALAQNDPAQARIAQGYFWSILFMMGMPFAILGTFGTCFYFQIRRARGQQSLPVDDGQPSPPTP